MNYLFRLSKLEEIVGQKISVHIVEKKVECLCEDGITRKPEKENGKIQAAFPKMSAIIDEILK